MEIDQTGLNCEQTELELFWLLRVIEMRFSAYFQDESGVMDPLTIEPPALNKGTGLAEIISQHNFSAIERLILALSITPELNPQMLDRFYTRNKKFDRGFTEFGGVKGEQHGGFLPTGETAAFIIAGNSLSLRIKVRQIFSQDHDFYRHDLIRLQPPKGDEPRLSGLLTPGPELLHRVLYNKPLVPEFNHSFPAKKLKPVHSWDDLILPDPILNQIDEITAWVDHQSTIMNDWGLKQNIKPGYRCLFYGPPGTGKTMVAGVVGKRTGYDVFRVDLSQIISKYIGETEKNLSRIFDRAEHQKWILFFDEADALFGQRTQTKSSNDRYSNQEVSYLLQRIEDFNGVIILATNLKENIDEAFTRRFQSTIGFPMPGEKERQQLWKSILNSEVPLAEDVDFERLAAAYRVSGGSMINVVRYGALKAVQRENGEQRITAGDLEEGLRRELKKYGKSLI